MVDTKQQSQEPTLIVEVAGVEYAIDLSDFDGLEWRDVKRATQGMSAAECFERVLKADFEAVASLVWIARRRTEPKVTFDQVLASMTLANTSSRIVEDDGEDDGGESPTEEPSGSDGD